MDTIKQHLKNFYYLFQKKDKKYADFKLVGLVFILMSAISFIVRQTLENQPPLINMLFNSGFKLIGIMTFILAIIFILIYVYVFNSLKNKYVSTIFKHIIFISILFLIIILPTYFIIRNIKIFLMGILFIGLFNLIVEKFESSDNFIYFLILTTLRILLFLISFNIIINLLLQENIINGLLYKFQNIFSIDMLKTIYSNLELIIPFLSLSTSYLITKITLFIFKILNKNKKYINLEIISINSNKFDWALFIFGFITIIFFTPETMKEYQGDFINIMTSFTLIDLLVSKLKNKL